ncbi:hypothetical protein, partial [Nonomuraea fuscirosea]|uniref:hypothetical protein n=1 Tax=Nonomuraea fuscirosea TaxID=1291556 RepID=UPI0033F693D2
MTDQRLRELFGELAETLPEGSSSAGELWHFHALAVFSELALTPSAHDGMLYGFEPAAPFPAGPA